MDMIYAVLKECKISCHRIASKIKHTTKQDDYEKNSGIQVILPSIILTIHNTFHNDIVDINLSFKGQGTNCKDAHDLASLLTKEFHAVLPSELEVVEKRPNGDKVPKHINILIKFENKFRFLVFFTIVNRFPNTFDEDNIT